MLRPIAIIFIILLNLTGCSKSDSSSTQSASEGGIDPFFSYQWHLSNSGVDGGVAGEDINVVPLWNSGNKGEGVIISIVDDGLESAHPDLNSNFNLGLSYNYSTQSSDLSLPKGQHGTNVAGIIAARDYNFIGVRGVAPRASIVGRNLLADGNQTLGNIQDSLTLYSRFIDVSNNSWGHADNTGQFYTAPDIWKTSIQTGLNNGRDGLGTVYVWAAGNGGLTVDDANYDGFTNYYGVITVCAVGNDGIQSTYSENGANLWLCAPSMNGVTSQNCLSGIVTTDLTGSLGLNTGEEGSCAEIGDTNYTRLFNGTSAAVPIVTGAVALLLKNHPQLSWREVKIILAQSARKNDASDADWTLNEVGLPISHKYGHGVIDISAANNLANSWVSIGSFLEKNFPTSGVKDVNSTIPDNTGSSLTSTISVSGSLISFIEYIQIEVNLTHDDWGDLDISLSRTYNGEVYTDRLASEHTCYNCSGNSCNSATSCTVSTNTFTFGSARHLGAPADGDWQLIVEDKESGNTGTLDSWKMDFYGH